MYPLSSSPTALILAQTNHLFQMSRGLCFTHVITVCSNSPQIVATVLLHHLKCYFPPCHPPLWSRQTWGLCTPTSFELFKSATITPRFFCCCFRRDKRPVNLHVVCSRVNAGWFGAAVGEWGWSEERGRWRGRWRKKVGFFLRSKVLCVCVCVRWPAYPSPFVSLCGAAVSAGGGHVKSQTLASRMAPLPGFSPSHPFSRFHSILLACSYEHIFSLLEWGQGGGGGGEGGGKTNTSKASRNRVYSCIWRGHLLLSDFHMAPKNRRLPVFPPIILQFALKYKPLWLIACHI